MVKSKLQRQLKEFIKDDGLTIRHDTLFLGCRSKPWNKNQDISLCDFKSLFNPSSTSKPHKT